jgi:hypothetical protein
MKLIYIYIYTPGKTLMMNGSTEKSAENGTI